MENFERKLKRAGFRSRQERRRADAKPIDPQKQERRASVVRKKLKTLGIDRGICLGCGRTDVSTLQFDHIAGRKHHHQLWPLCFDCHQEKTFMGYLDPPPSTNPNNVFDVIGHWLLNVANYLDIAIRFVQIVISQLRAYGYRESNIKRSFLRGRLYQHAKEMILRSTHTNVLEIRHRRGILDAVNKQL